MLRNLLSNEQVASDIADRVCGNAVNSTAYNSANKRYSFSQIYYARGPKLGKKAKANCFVDRDDNFF